MLAFVNVKMASEYLPTQIIFTYKAPNAPSAVAAVLMMMR